MFDVILIVTVNWCLRIELPAFEGINMQRPKTFFSFMQKRHRHSYPFSLIVSVKLSYDFLDILQLLEESICIADFSFCSKYIRQFHDESDSSTVYCYCFPSFVFRNGTIWSLWLKRCNLDLLRSWGIWNSEIYLTDEMVLECLNIETLAIRQSDGMKDVKISLVRYFFPFSPFLAL